MNTAQPSRSEQIESDAARIDIADAASYLQDHLGQRPTAYLSGIKNAKTVGQWATGRVRPRESADLRLRHGYKVVRLIVEAFGEQAARAWLFGTNRQLGDRAPISVLRTSKEPREVVPVIQAAYGFVEGGRRPASHQQSTDIQILAQRVRSLERSSNELSHQVHELIDQLKGTISASEEVAS